VSLKGKIRVIVVVAAAGLVALAGLWLKSERSSLLSERQQSTENLLSVPYSMLVEQYRMEAEGKITRAEAQKHALDLIRAMRYDDNNYFWINDLHPTMVMHPVKPEMNGQDLTSVKDPTGKSLFLEIVSAARTPRGGFVFYRWTKPGRNQPVQKLSFVKQFEPWGWVIGTGVYIEDIDATWLGYAKWAAAVGLSCLTVLLVVSTRVSRSIFVRLENVVTRMKDAAEGEGDLTKRIEIDSSDEIAELGSWFNTFMDKLQGLVTQVASNTHRLASASEEISVTSRQQADGAEVQREQTTQIATALHEMSDTVQRVSENSSAAAGASRKAAEMAGRGGLVVEETLTRMRAIADSVAETAKKVEELGKRSEQIGQISGVIDDIADQTNLLALNAAIEAARAGEYGRGFAVVADEVRKLAVRSSTATGQITETIKGIQSETADVVTAMQAATRQVESGVESTGEAGRQLREIILSSEQAGEMVMEIATAASEQATATEQINQNIAQIAEIITHNADMAQQSSKAHDELSMLALDLQRLVAQFKLDDDDSAHQKNGRADMLAGMSGNSLTRSAQWYQ
jgi:methyl-accepting chemotaxis protein